MPKRKRFGSYASRSRKRRRIFRARRRKYSRWTRKTGPGLSRKLPLPKTLKTTLRYVERDIVVNPGTGGVAAVHFFSMNSLYDPNKTGVGHKCMGFDELMTFYDHYTVIGSRIKVTACNLDTSNQQYISVNLTDDSGAPGDIEPVIENAMGRWTVIGQKGSGRDIQTLTLNCSPNRFFGKKVIGDDKYQGGVSSNPTDQVFTQICVQPVTGVDSSEARIIVEIEYITVFSEPKVLTQS